MFDRNELRRLLQGYDHVERGRLAQRLDVLIMALCAAQSQGPAVIKYSLDDRIDGMCTSGVQGIVEALEDGLPNAEADDLRRMAGPGLAQAWRAHFGSRRHTRRRLASAKRKANNNRRSPSSGTHPENLQGWQANRSVRRNHDNAPVTPTAPSGELGSNSTVNMPVLIQPMPKSNDSLADAKTTMSRKGSIRGKKRIRVPHFARILSIVFFFSFVATTAGYVMVDPDLRAYNTLIKFGGRESIDILKAQLNGRAAGDYGYYLLAFGQYRTGNLEEARKIIIDLLNDTKRDYIRSDCYYLLGLLERELGDNYISIGNLRQSAKCLEDAGGDGIRSYLINLELAKSYLESDDVKHAKDFFNASEALKQHSPNLFEFWQTKGRIGFSEGYYQSALASFENSREFAVNDIQKFAYHAWVGMSCWATGDIVTASTHADHAEALTYNTWMKVHLNILKIAIRSCYEQDYSVLEKQVKDWLSSHPKTYLENKLKLAKQCI